MPCGNVAFIACREFSTSRGSAAPQHAACGRRYMGAAAALLAGSVGGVALCLAAEPLQPVPQQQPLVAASTAEPTAEPKEPDLWDRWASIKAYLNGWRRWSVDVPLPADKLKCHLPPGGALGWACAARLQTVCPPAASQCTLQPYVVAPAADRQALCAPLLRCTLAPLRHISHHHPPTHTPIHLCRLLYGVLPPRGTGVLRLLQPTHLHAPAYAGAGTDSAGQGVLIVGGCGSGLGGLVHAGAGADSAGKGRLLAAVPCLMPTGAGLADELAGGNRGEHGAGRTGPSQQAKLANGGSTHPPSLWLTVLSRSLPPPPITVWRLVQEGCDVLGSYMSPVNDAYWKQVCPVVWLTPSPMPGVRGLACGACWLVPRTGLPSGWCAKPGRPQQHRGLSWWHAFTARLPEMSPCRRWQRGATACACASWPPSNLVGGWG